MSRNLELERSDQRLMAKQAVVQARKFRGRLADDYDNRIFPIGENRNSIKEFLEDRLGGEVSCVQEILEGLAKKQKHKIHWVDMGGGRGLAMRQLALKPIISDQVDMTNVDFFNPDLVGLKEAELTYLQEDFPGILKNNVKPKYLKGNVEIIQLPKKADLTTSIEVTQYLDHPIAAICNWYNQLVDDGILLISGEQWSRWIRYENTIFMSDPHPFDQILEILKTKNIPFAISGQFKEAPKRKDFSTMAIQKVPCTSLVPLSPAKRIRCYPKDYKAVYYDSNTPSIEVLNDKNPSSIIERYLDHLSSTVGKG